MVRRMTDQSSLDETWIEEGRPVAQLSPLPSGRLAALLDSGQARAAKRSIADLPSARPGTSVTEALLATRADERAWNAARRPQAC